jgi:predicted ester cyclase
LPAFGEIVAPDGVLHAASFPDEVGPAAIASLFDALFAGFSDLKFTVQPGPAAGDRVVEIWTATGTNDGSFQGIAATGKTATWMGINIYRVACGKIAEIWTEADALGRLEQMGLPAPGATPAATPAA